MRASRIMMIFLYLVGLVELLELLGLLRRWIGSPVASLVKMILLATQLAVYPARCMDQQ